MKKLFAILLLILFSSCSFDNKTGIWNNTNTSKVKFDKYKDFKKLYSDKESFKEIINHPKNLKVLLSAAKSKYSWNDEFYQESDNFYNFNYKNLNELTFRSKKISRYNLNDKFLFYKKNILLNDDRGNIIVYSLEREEVVYKFNFYKNKFKKIKKNLNVIINKDIIYITDNIGYFYALNYSQKRLLWAKNFKVPFRSNLKIVNDKIIAVDQNNVLYVIDKSNGDRLKTLPTEETTLKNQFVNSLSSSDNSMFFLNSYGSLYSINNKEIFIQWIVNLNQSLEINPGNLFYSKPLLISENKIIVCTKDELYILNIENGAINSKKLITSVIEPVINKNNLFLITKDNLLVLINLSINKIIYSINIEKKIADFLATKQKSILVQSAFISDNKLFILLENSYIIKLNVNGTIEAINKLPTKIKSKPIFISDSMIYLDKNNKLNILN